jgi:hypothetical protein
MHDPTIPAARQQQPPAARDTVLDLVIADRLAAELAAIREAEPRTDTKAGNLQQLCSGLLLAGLALLGSGTMPAPAAALGWAAAGLLGGAIVLLSAATRPNLRGNFGFVRWAQLPNDHALITAIAAEAGPGVAHTGKARQVRWLSRSLHGKFTRIRAAHTLFTAALAVAALAAALTAIGR